MLRFLVSFGRDIATPFISIGSYVSLISRLLFWIGLCFETPLVVFILARVGIVTGDKLKKAWRWSVLGAFVLGAIITPTFDPINQTLVAAPLLALYWLSVGLAYVAQSRRRKERLLAEE
jgi:sec-independent protein translocase protein TatC